MVLVLVLEDSYTPRPPGASRSRIPTLPGHLEPPAQGFLHSQATWCHPLEDSYTPRPPAPAHARALAPAQVSSRGPARTVRDLRHLRIHRPPAASRSVIPTLPGHLEPPAQGILHSQATRGLSLNDFCTPRSAAPAPAPAQVSRGGGGRAGCSTSSQHLPNMSVSTTLLEPPAR